MCTFLFLFWEVRPDRNVAPKANMDDQGLSFIRALHFDQFSKVRPTQDQSPSRHIPLENYCKQALASRWSYIKDGN